MYSRWGNPTADSACHVLTQLEGAAGSLLFSSGCGAISTVLFSFLKAGDHMVRMWDGLGEEVHGRRRKREGGIWRIEGSGMYKILIRSEIKMRFLTIIGGGPSLAPVKCIFIFVCVYLQGTIFLC